jgi:hypothetical protein
MPAGLTERNQAAAYEMILASEEDGEERKILCRMFSAYEMCDDEADFRKILRLPDTTEASELFSMVHVAYVVAWKRYGFARLQLMCECGWHGLTNRDGRLM